MPLALRQLFRHTLSILPADLRQLFRHFAARRCIMSLIIAAAADVSLMIAAMLCHTPPPRHDADASLLPLMPALFMPPAAVAAAMLLMPSFAISIFFAFAADALRYPPMPASFFFFALLRHY